MGKLQSKLDLCFYYKIENKDNMLLVAIYVDDLLIYKEQLNKNFKMNALAAILLSLYLLRGRIKVKAVTRGFLS